MSKSETSDVQEKLIVIWERDSDNADEVDNLTKEFKFITEILKESHPTRILKMSVQVIERFCTNHELSQFVGEGFQSLLDLIQSSSEKPLRIMAAQSVSRIAQSAVQSDADALLASVETILQSETTELLVCRPLRDASQYLKQLITSSNGHVDDDEQREENEDFQNDQGTYDPRYLDEEDANEEEGDDENDRGNEEHDGVSDTVTLGAPFDGSNEELLDALSSDIKDTLKTILSQINDMRLLEIRGRLKSFFRPNLTSPELICKHMRMGTAQVQKLFRLSGLHYSGYQPMTPADFETLMTALTTLANEDFYAAAIAYLQIDETAIPNPRSRPAPQEISTEAASLEPEKLGHAARRSKEWASVRNSRGDVIQHDDATSFLLLRNLPINVSVQELLPLLRKYADCPYLDTSDIVLPSTVRTPRAKLMEIGAHAYVNFRHIRDARKAKAALNGRDFGGRPIEIDYSIGKPTNKVWIGGVPAGLTPAMLAEYMSKFGQMSESIDIKGRGRGDAFAFAVFNSVDDAARAVKALSEANNTIEGHVVRIGYNSTKSEFDDKDRDQARDQDHRDREMDRTRPRDYPREQGQERYRERDREQESRSHSWDAPPYRVDYSRTDPRRAFMGGREDEYPRDRQGYGNYPDEREYIDDRPMRAPIDSAVERDYRGGEGKRRYDAHSYHYPDRAPALYERRDSRDDNSWGAPVPSRQYDESYAQRPQHNEYPVRAPQGYSTASVQAQYAPYDEPYGKSGAQYRDAPRPPPPDYSAHNAPYDNKRSRYNDYTAPHPPLPPSRGSSGGHSLMQPTSRSYAPPPPPSRPRPHY